MNLLAFDTSTEWLYIALQRGDQTWHYEGAGAAQSSASILPTILRLMEEAGLSWQELDAIALGCGPGSFTGLRTSCAVAQGLVFGSGARAKPIAAIAVDSMQAVAEDARLQWGHTHVAAALDARMQEIYTATLQWNGSTWQRKDDIRLVAPAQLQVPPGAVLAGNAHVAYAREMAELPHLAQVTKVSAAPTAKAILSVAPALLHQGQILQAHEISPVYVRNKVALTIQERLQKSP